MNSSMPSRQPDYISPNGGRYWFEEMLCCIGGDGTTRRLLLNVNGHLCINNNKKGMCNQRTQKAYIEWKHTQAEKVLLDEASQEVEKRD